MSNPYQSPHFGGQIPAGMTPGPPGVDREKLRRVARYQQWVIYAILANIGINIASMAVRGQDPLLQLGIVAVALVILILVIAAIGLLANELMGIGMAIVCGVLMILPCISLITLLVVNQKATAYLQQHGIQVGLMGANPNNI
jgi:hypothetical protein